jgi:hypothetical protein
MSTCIDRGWYYVNTSRATNQICLPPATCPRPGDTWALIQFPSSGTLGCAVYRNADNRKYALTNNHVCGQAIFDNGVNLPTAGAHPELANCVQQASGDGGSQNLTNSNPDKFGHTAFYNRYVVNGTSGPDAALVALDNESHIARDN